jgi:hypothetical protein
MRLRDITHRQTHPDDVLLVAVPEQAVAVVTVRTCRGLRRRTRRAIVPASCTVVAFPTPGDRRCSVEVRTPTAVRCSRVAASTTSTATSVPIAT